jgi:hypothetical protein
MNPADPADPHAEQLRDLERQFPGWQVWHSGHKWCARPWPLINADSPEELAERIRTAHMSPPDGSPSLASWRSYLARARQLRDWEKTATETWLKMRDEADRRRRFPLRHRARRTGADETTADPAAPAAAAAGATPPDIIT